METLIETPKSEIVPQNAAASNVGVEINIEAEIRAASIGKVSGKMAIALGHTKQELTADKLLTRVCVVMKSKRGLAERQLPEAIYNEVVAKVAAFINGRVAKIVARDGLLVETSGYVFRLGSETNPVRHQFKLTNTATISIAEQMRALTMKETTLAAQEQRESAASNHGKASKLRLSLEKIREAKALLGKYKMDKAIEAIKEGKPNPLAMDLTDHESIAEASAK